MYNAYAHVMTEQPFMFSSGFCLYSFGMLLHTSNSKYQQIFKTTEITGDLNYFLAALII